jgi:hypothetical protein
VADAIAHALTILAPDPNHGRLDLRVGYCRIYRL